MPSALCEYLIDRTAFEKEKELTDRALKLAEVGKPKANWELQGGIGISRLCLRISAKKIRREAHMVNILGVSAGALLQSLSFFVGTLFSLQ